MADNSTGFDALNSGLRGLTSANSDVIKSRYWDVDLDIAGRYLPESLRTFRRLCLRFALTHPIIAPLIHKRSTYVVTEPIFSGGDETTRDLYQDFFSRKFRVRPFIAGFNIDRNTFGNGYVRPVYPMEKYLKCRSCNTVERAHTAEFQLEGEEFQIKCRKCGRWRRADAKDSYIKDLTRLRFQRMNSQYIFPEQDPLSGEVDYYYVPPAILKNALTMQNRAVIARTPQEFIQAVARGKAVKMGRNHFFASHRMGPTNEIYRGEGIPLLMPALKSAHLLQIMNKAQEAILYEQIIPMRIATPADPNMLLQLGGLADFNKVLANQIKNWRADQNTAIVLPLPVLIQEFGGKGRALLLNPEIRMQAELICASLGWPVEMLFGGLSYSGSNVSLRIVENDLMFDFNEDVQLLQFMCDCVGKYMEWPSIQGDMQKFKMADDLPRAAFLAQLKQQDLISRSTFLQHMDFDPQKEAYQIVDDLPIEGKILRARQVVSAKAQATAQMIQVQFQLELQKLQAALGPAMPAAVPTAGAPNGASAMSPEEAMATMGSPNEVGQGMFLPQDYAGYLAQRASNMPRVQQVTFLKDIRDKAGPGVADAVQRQLAMGGPDAATMAPLPTQLPPRRGPEHASI